MAKASKKSAARLKKVRAARKKGKVNPAKKKAAARKVAKKTTRPSNKKKRQLPGSKVTAPVPERTSAPEPGTDNPDTSIGHDAAPGSEDSHDESLLGELGAGDDRSEEEEDSIDSETLDD